ncbi:solute carrier family 22 member 6-A-like isoform X3 [Hemitrygon akajei]|uniref:solute carrier family 22 member 6-A-like isoform X3 n=1 Tax=Hemitrygon akajei TaxID=2704970 RepID=UPI003BF9C94C
MAFGDLLEMVGGLGKFQAIHIVLLSIPYIFASCHNVLQNFMAAVPDHWCRVPQGDQGSRYLNVTEELLREEFLRVFLPLDEEGRPDKCRMYSSPQWHLLGTNETQGNGSQPDTQACTDGWVYNRSQFTSTIVTEWDLVCDRKSLKQMVQSIYMAGLLIGACVLGRLSDKWLSESARWLIVNGKEHVALKQLKRVAKLNGREAEGERLTVEILKASVENDQLTDKSQSVLDLFRTPVMRRITCCMMVVWFSMSFAYYGLSIDLQGFGVNIYLIQLIFGAVDFPAKIVTFLTLSLIGRRFTQVTSLTLAGSTLLANAIIPKDLQTVRISLAAFGKGCLAATFSGCYLHTGELFPTVVRQTGMGLSSSMARLGAMVAPVVRMSGDYIPFLPSTIYGGMAVIAGVTAFFLLETRNVPLPETIDDVENRAKKSSKRVSKLRNEDVPLQEVHTSLMKQTVEAHPTPHPDAAAPCSYLKAGRP